jgi:hypothetical protein
MSIIRITSFISSNITSFSTNDESAQFSCKRLQALVTVTAIGCFSRRKHGIGLPVFCLVPGRDPNEIEIRNACASRTQSSKQKESNYGK